MFNIGDKVVYPMHGAGIIEGIEEREILGEKRKYFVMRMPIGDVKVMVPLANMNEVGVREVIKYSDFDKVIAVLKGDKTFMSENWNKRYRENMDRIKSGDIFELAEVVRNLLMLDNEKGLSTGERKMFNSAKQMLLSEMALVSGLEVDEVDDLIIKAVTEEIIK